jgi:hypothetical protein
MCGSFLELFSYIYKFIVLASIDKMSVEHPTNTVEQTISQSPVKNVKPLTTNAYYMDISEHRALLVNEHLSQICVSHIESLNLVYIMTENDYERAIKLLEAMKCIDTIQNEESFKY